MTRQTHSGGSIERDMIALAGDTSPDGAMTRDDTAYDILVDLVGRHVADDIVAALAAAGYVIVPDEDDARREDGAR